MEDICPICLELMSEDCFETRCDHKFHGECLTKWLNKNNTCPSCRINIKTNPELNIQQTLFGNLFSIEESGFNLNPEITYDEFVANSYRISNGVSRFLQRLGSERINRNNIADHLGEFITYASNFISDTESDTESEDEYIVLESGIDDVE